MKIGELAASAGCDVQTVRYYEREGLLEAPERDVSGYRRYADRHVQRMQFIRHCRSLDVPLSDVRQLLASRRRRSSPAQPSTSCLTSILRKSSESAGRWSRLNVSLSRYASVATAMPRSRARFWSRL